MGKSSDVIVIGGGAMGAPTAYELAKSGKVKVLLFDRYDLPHSFGSTHGESRITRQAIGEDKLYTKLSLRSYDHWRRIHQATGDQVLTITGGLIIASKKREVMHGRIDFFEETVRAAQDYKIRHEILNGKEAQNEFPQFNFSGDEDVYYEYEAGILHPENCVRVQLKLARQHGAEIKTNDEVLDIVPIGNDRVVVFASSGVYETGKVVITAGPWIGQLLASKYRELFKVYRQVMYWFKPKSSITLYSVVNFPIFLWQFDGGFLYGFPHISGDGVKVATEKFDKIIDPEMVSREVSEEEKKDFYDNFISCRLPGLSNECARAVSCLYTMTPDSHFIIDFHPEFPQVIIASPCSGHGFKHSPAIGEILAEMAIEGKSTFDISPFSIKRF